MHRLCIRIKNSLVYLLFIRYLVPTIMPTFVLYYLLDVLVSLKLKNNIVFKTVCLLHSDTKCMALHRALLHFCSTVLESFWGEF